ncbi:MAG TPA: glycosyl hydrolase family 98, partial [Xylanibacter oryzae]|nr:glycosyl hydrolase family 98 [Xylanibacter oryzae]
TDMFRKVIDGSLYIPTRAEVVGNTKIAVVNDISSGSDEDMYAAWGDLYDGLYKQNDPFNKGTGQWMDNMCYFKKTGRYATIPIALDLYDDVAKSIPVKVYKSAYSTHWTSNDAKVAEFNSQYPEVSKGDLYVSRYKNQLVTYTPYTYLNSKTFASARIPLKYNTCDSLKLNYGKLSSGLIKEYADHIDMYLNNFRTDTTTSVSDVITVTGATAKPIYTLSKRVDANAVANESWNAVDGTYSLDVSHMGPVNVSIKCSGNGVDRSSDVVSSSALSADLPKQPNEYYGEIVAEAEDMDYKDIKSCVVDPYGLYPNERGNAGNGFIDMGTSTTGSLRHVVNVKRAGSYNIAVRYTADGADGRLSVSMNTATKALSCPQTGTNEWKKVSFTAYMNKGDNTLVITNAGGTEMYIDQVIYTPADQPAEKFAVIVRDVEHGKVVANVSSAEEGSIVKLTVIPDEGYSLTTIDLIHGDITVNSDNSFIMPDDNVTLLPAFKDLSSVYKMDMTKTLSGTLPDGWRSVQESSTVHEFPNSYSSGSRIMTGFTGYQGKGLYWRNDCAEYGKQTDYLLTLKPGDYKLVFAMAAWKDSPNYKAQIINSNGTAIATSSVYTATPNAAGSSLADISSAIQNELAFTVTTTGNYVINFSDATSAGGFHEFLLLECNLIRTDATGINQINSVSDKRPVSFYNISGMKQNTLTSGINIIRQPDGKTVKVLKK